MARCAAIVSLFLILGMDGFCADPPDKEEKDAPNLVLGVWKVPPGFISTPNPSDKNGTRKPRPGFESKQNSSALLIDASEYLKSLGLTFPAGSHANFDQKSSSLIMLNTQANLDLVDTLAGCTLGPPPTNLVVEISTFEFRLPADNFGPSTTWPTFSALHKIPAADKRLLDRVSVLTKSGHRASMKHILLPDPAPVVSLPDDGDEAGSADGFQNGESGTIVDCEPIVGPDSVTIDAFVSYRFRSPPSRKTSSEIRFNADFTTWEGYPVVLHVSPSPTEEGKFIVVVASIRLVNAGGWNLTEAVGSPEPTSSPEG